jgi:hypothetical protein
MWTSFMHIAHLPVITTPGHGYGVLDLEMVLDLAYTIFNL